MGLCAFDKFSAWIACTVANNGPYSNRSTTWSMKRLLRAHIALLKIKREIDWLVIFSVESCLDLYFGANV